MDEHEIPFFGKRTRPALAAAVFLLGFFIFSPSLRAPFIHDDDVLLLRDNAEVFSWSSLGSLASPDYFKIFREDSYHPAATFLYVAAGNIFGHTPFGFHLLNLILHCLCSILVIKCGAKLSGSIGVGAAAGLLFLSHPVHVEPVIVSSFNEDIVAAFFSLWAVWTVLKQEESGQSRLLTAGFYCLALLSKESAVFLPLVFAAAVPFKKIRGTLAFCLAALFFYAAVRVFVSPGRGEFSPDFHSISLNPLPVLSLYCAMWFFPAKLSSVYQPPGIGTVLTGITLAVSAGLCAAFSERGKRVFAVSAACFAAGVMLYLNLLPLRALAAYLNEIYAADRYLYFSSAGLAWISAAGAGALLDKAGLSRRGGAGIAAVAVSLLAILSFYHQSIWMDSALVWKRAVEVSPSSARSNLTFGRALIRTDASSAIAFLRRGLGHSSIVQMTTKGESNLGLAYLKKGDIKRAVFWFRAAIKLSPSNAYAWNGLAAALAVSGDLKGAGAACEKGLALSPGSAVLRENLEKLRSFSGDSGSAQE